MYRQIADYIEALIRSGELREGAKIHSERALAELFGVSRNTVSAAYSYLYENGLIVKTDKTAAIVGSGQVLPSKRFNWGKIMDKGRQNIADDGFVFADGYNKGVLHLTRRHVHGGLNFAEYFFNAVNPANWQISDISGEDAIDKRGVYALREAVAAHMTRLGVSCNPDQIMIFTSITQILNTLAGIFLNMGTTYYHERTSFINLRDMMRSSGANFVPMDFDDEGPCLEKLKSKLRPRKNAFFHTHINNHNPTGITASPRRRKEVMDIARRWGMPVVEMDSMQGIYHLKKEPSPLKSMDQNGQVIYIGSFLRPTSEVLGLAWIVADEYLINAISRRKQPIDIHPNLIAQLAAATFMRSGLFYDYQQKIRHYLSRQLSFMNEAMQRHIGDIADWDRERSSYYIWPEFEKGINVKTLYKNRTDIDFNPGFFYDSTDSSHISITTLCTGHEMFDEALRRLRRLVDRNTKKS